MGKKVIGSELTRKLLKKKSLMKTDCSHLKIMNLNNEVYQMFSIVSELSKLFDYKNRITIHVMDA